jgi:branched-chain amino acid transport system ATP-binding protein
MNHTMNETMTEPADNAVLAHGAAASEPVLELSGITMKISGLTALNTVSFKVEAGKIVSLIGPNGAGKTTTFNVISGYMRPTAGTVKLFGRDVTGLNPDDIAALGLVRTFQRTSVFNQCTVFDNLLTAFHLQGKSGLLGSLLRTPAFRREEAALRERAAAMLDFLGLRHRADEIAETLSYGEQRLLGVGIGLAAQPRLLLLDEPAAGLNPSETDTFKETIRKISALGVTVLLVEHDMQMVMSISDHIVVLNHGQLIATGLPHEIQQHPEVIRAYLGSGVKRAQA